MTTTKPQASPNPFLDSLEDALAERRVWALMGSGKHWLVRRNGQTIRRVNGAWRIPIKAGLRSYGAITDRSSVGIFGNADWRSAEFVIVSSASVNPNEVNTSTPKGELQ